MVKPNLDPVTGDTLPPFGVENDDDGFYKKYKTPETEVDALYIIKANAPLNTEAYSYVQTQMSSGKIKFLKDENWAKAKLQSTKVGREMTTDARAEYLRPFVLTTILREQLLNLVEDNAGVNIILKQDNRSIPKDKVSAFAYGMYYIRQNEERKRKRHKRDISKMMFFS